VLLDIGITLCLNIDVMRDERLAVPHEPLDPGRAKDGLDGVDAIGLEWCVRAVYDTVQYSLGELALPPFRIDRLADRVGTDPDIAQELPAGLISHPGHVRTEIAPFLVQPPQQLRHPFRPEPGEEKLQARKPVKGPFEDEASGIGFGEVRHKDEP